MREPKSTRLFAKAPPHTPIFDEVITDLGYIRIATIVAAKSIYVHMFLPINITTIISVIGMHLGLSSYLIIEIFI